MERQTYMIFIAVVFLVSLSVYFQRDSKGYIRLFPLFLSLTVIVELVSSYLLTNGGQSIILYNLFGAIEFLFYMYVLREIIQNKKVKKIIFLTSWLYLLLVLINFFFVQKITSFNSMTYGLGCLLIVAICIFYFYELFQLSHSVNLVRQSAFWICSGLLFYYCCSFPIYGLLNFLRSAPPIIQKNIEVIIFLLNIFLYSSFTIAFLCRLKTRKSMS